MTETCFYCKWFAIKIMLNGYHGICNNPKQNKWYHMSNETCEYFKARETAERNENETD